MCWIKIEHFFQRQVSEELSLHLQLWNLIAEGCVCMLICVFILCMYETFMLTWRLSTSVSSDKLRQHGSSKGLGLGKAMASPKIYTVIVICVCFVCKYDHCSKLNESFLSFFNESSHMCDQRLSFLLALKKKNVIDHILLEISFLLFTWIFPPWLIFTV